MRAHVCMHYFLYNTILPASRIYTYTHTYTCVHMRVCTISCITLFSSLHVYPSRGRPSFLAGSLHKAVCVCMYVCMYVCRDLPSFLAGSLPRAVYICIYVCMHACPSRSHLSFLAGSYVYVCMYVCMYVWLTA